MCDRLDHPAVDVGAASRRSPAATEQMVSHRSGGSTLVGAKPCDEMASPSPSRDQLSTCPVAASCRRRAYGESAR